MSNRTDWRAMPAYTWQALKAPSEMPNLLVGALFIADVLLLTALIWGQGL